MKFFVQITTKISVLDFNQNVPLGLRALCKKCKSINPTNIEEALNQWNEYKAQQKKNIEQQFEQVCFPMQEIESSLKRIKMNMIENIDDVLNLIEFLIQPTVEYKDQKIQELESFGKEKTLSSLQKIAEIVCVNKQIDLNQVIEKNIKENLQKIKIINYNLDCINQKYQLLFQNIRYIQNISRSKELFKKGEDLHDNKKLNEAIKFYDEAISVNPVFQRAFYCKGIALQELKKYDEAVKCYDEAIRINPQYSDAFNNKGYLLSLKKSKEAIVNFDESIRLNPKNPSAFNNKGRLFNYIIQALVHLGYDDPEELNAIIASIKK